MKKLFSGIKLFLLCSSLAFGQDVQFRYNGGRNYSLVERTDLRRYENNRYVGLLSREIRSFISNDGDLYEGSFYVSQDTVRASAVVGDRIHDSIPSRFKIDSDGNLTMLEDNGYPTFRSFPAFTTNRIKPGDSWQASAVRAVDPMNKGIVTKIPMRVQYTYTGDENIRGEEVYVLSAKWATRYGPNLYLDFGGDKELKQAQGKHEATMYVSKETGNAIVVRDSVDETFIYADGKAETFRGTISLFTEYPPAVDRSKIIRALQRVAAISDDDAKLLVQRDREIAAASRGKSLSRKTAENTKPAVAAVPSSGSRQDLRSNAQKQSSADSSVAQNKTVSSTATSSKNPVISQSQNGNRTSSAASGTAKPTASSIATAIAATTVVSKDASDKAIQEASKPIKVEDTDAGIRLTIQNLQFKPDSAELVSGEKSRLDQIASVLREVPQSQFLVEGHTASTGYEEGEMRLSAQRAHAIAKELAARGIPAEKFICKGSGAHKPIADNSTPQGKAVNRRVEITILE